MKTYLVAGMTCGHCEASVTEELERVAGVTGIEVDRESGRLTLTGERFTDESVREAVSAAGFEVVVS